MSFGFAAHFAREVVARFDGGTVTSDAGALLLREAERRIRLLPRLALDLAAKLMARALSAEAAGTPEPMALFDAGYFVETLKQAALVYRYDMLSPEEKKSWVRRDDIIGIDGFAWVQRSMRFKGENADMRYALSLIDYDRGKTKSRLASK